MCDPGVVWLLWNPEPKTDHLSMRYTLLHEVCHFLYEERVGIDVINQIYDTIEGHTRVELTIDEHVLELCEQIGVDPEPYRQMSQQSQLGTAWLHEERTIVARYLIGVDDVETADVCRDTLEVDPLVNELDMDEIVQLCTENTRSSSAQEYKTIDALLKFNRAMLRTLWLPQQPGVTTQAPLPSAAEREGIVRTVEVWVSGSDHSRKACYRVWGHRKPEVLQGPGTLYAMSRMVTWSGWAPNSWLFPGKRRLVVYGAALNSLTSLRILYALITHAIFERHDFCRAGMRWEFYGDANRPSRPRLYRCTIWYEIEELYPRALDVWMIASGTSAILRGYEHALQRFASEWLLQASFVHVDRVAPDADVLCAQLRDRVDDLVTGLYQEEDYERLRAWLPRAYELAAARLEDTAEILCGPLEQPSEGWGAGARPPRRSQG